MALNCRCGVSGKVAQDNLRIFGLIWRTGVRFGFVSSVPINFAPKLNQATVSNFEISN